LFITVCCYSLNSRFGTIAVPNIMVFHNAKAVARFNGTERTLTNIAVFVSNITGHSCYTLLLAHFLLIMQQMCPHWWGTALAWRWSLWAPSILQIPLFRNLKGRRLLRVPQFGPPQNPAYGGAKISGDPIQSV